MASQVQESFDTPVKPVLTPVTGPAVACGDCRYHVSGATTAAAWCRLKRADAYGQPVTQAQTACADFASWPESSPVPAFLAAMRL
jgi:hypothetical protein